MASIPPASLELQQPPGNPLASGGPANDFQTVALGTGGLVKTFTLHNDGWLDLHLGTIATSGADAADFVVDATGMSATVAAGGTTSFTVRFDPATTGAKTAQLEIPSDAANGTLFTVPLSGTGATVSGAYDLAAEDAVLSGVDADPGAIPHGDGLPNLLKYAFHLDLSGPDHHALTPGGDSGLPVLTTGSDGGGPFWRLEFIRRKASGLEYGVEKSPNLLPGSFTPVDLAPAVVSDVDDFWERVVLKQAFDPQSTPKTFLRAVVRVP